MVAAFIYFDGSQQIVLKIATGMRTTDAVCLAVIVLNGLVCRAEFFVRMHQHGMHLRGIECVARQFWACSASAYLAAEYPKVAAGGDYCWVRLHMDRQ